MDRLRLLKALLRRVPGLPATWRAAGKLAALVRTPVELKRNQNFFEHGLLKLRNKCSEEKPLVVFFSPSAVSQYLQTQLVLARTMQNKGNEVLFVACQQRLPRCMLMNIMGLTPSLDASRSRQFCINCAGRTRKMLSRFGLSAIDLGQLVGEAERRQIAQKICSLPNLDDFEHDGHRIQDLVLIDLALSYKSRTLAPTDPDLALLTRNYAASAVIAYEAMKRLATQRKIAAIVYNSEYTHHLAASLAVVDEGIPVINVGALSHRYADRRGTFMFRKLWEIAAYDVFAAWPQWRELPLKREAVREIAEDIMVRLRGAGPNIYSQPVTQRTRSLREHLGVPKNRRLLVAYTSSVDEEICTKKALDVFSVAPPSFEQPYSDQITWLQEIAAFVEKRDDLYLIVRIHPREGRNHIDNIESDHLHALRHSFSQRDLQNTTFIWPENKISSYDLGEEANLVLISWSNIGLELSRLAVPVLASMIRISTVPHDDFIVRVPDKERYYQKIDELLVRPPNLATVQHAFRWYGVTKFATSIDISDVLPTPLGDEIRDFVLPRNHELIEKVILGGCAIHELQLERHQMASKPDDLEQESAEIALQFRRILHFLMTGNDIDGDKPLSLVWGDAAQLRPSIGCETENCIFTDGVNCTYISDRKTFNKYSPLVSRMAQIGGTPVSAPPPGTRQANDAVGEKVHA